MKRIVAIFMVLMIVLALCGCSNPEKGDTLQHSKHFIILDYDLFNNNYRSYTVYHKDTGVVYIVLTATHSIEIEVAPLYNADGSIMTLDDWRGYK